MQSSGVVGGSGTLYFAGNNTYGQGGPNIPRQDDISTFTAEGYSFPTLPGGQTASANAPTVSPLVFSTGAYHSAAVIPSGSSGSSQPAAGQLYTWGSNYYGNLGDGTMNDSATPIAVTGMANVIAAAAGNGKTVAVLADGTVWDWGGYVPYPALGNGTTDASSTPVQVSGLSNVTAVATAEYFGFHSLALKNDGTVWAWGPNFDGQIGDGTTTDRSTPVQVSGLTGITALAASNAGSFALKNDGTVWAWGQIGADSNGIAVTSPTPMQIQGLSNVIAIAAGRSHCLALEKDGTVWAWATDQDGNFYGQLGNGTTTNSFTPAKVMSLSGVTNIGAGGFHSLAELSDGSLWTWGRNSSGQLGDGTTTDQSTPVQVEGPVLQ
jgi:alpha-tubulin suppressor-like RCC1 family protein